MIIKNANVVTPGGIIRNGSVVIRDGIIVDISLSGSFGEGISAEGLYLLPGFVDIHCDIVEKRIEPRPNVQMPFDLALIELDRELLSFGITTMFHSISFAGVELGLRANDAAERIVREIHRLKDYFLVNTYVHARFEITNAEAIPIVRNLIMDGLVRLLSFMDHTPGQGQFRTVNSFKHYYQSVYEKKDRELDEIIAMKLRSRAKASEIIESTARVCRSMNVPMAVHDADRGDQIEWFKKMGVIIAEFPVTHEAVRAAHRLGLFICLGAPNVLRGVSQTGNLSARDLIRDGYGSILCSDYSPMTMLHALVTLVRNNILNLHEAVAMASIYPAQAVGLGDRIGSIEIGKQADMVLVDLSSFYPRIVSTIIRGEEVYRTVDCPCRRSLTFGVEISENIIT